MIQVTKMPRAMKSVPKSHVMSCLSFFFVRLLLFQYTSVNVQYMYIYFEFKFVFGLKILMRVNSFCHSFVQDFLPH